MGCLQISSCVSFILRFHVPLTSCNVSASLSDLLHSVGHSLGPSMVRQMALLHSFRRLSNIPLYQHASTLRLDDVKILAPSVAYSYHLINSTCHSDDCLLGPCCGIQNDLPKRSTPSSPEGVNILPSVTKGTWQVSFGLKTLRWDADCGVSG